LDSNINALASYTSTGGTVTPDGCRTKKSAILLETLFFWLV
jgi:hypothetical protein